MIGSVEKHLFYDEYFTIMKICDTEGQLLGYYSDVATPLQKTNDEYSLSDLILDVWIYPNSTILELDRDEFEEAISKGLLSIEQQTKAEEVLERLKIEIRRGIFPSAYLL
jgi:predicted RNA-binding protein associated with RNAse of E/G family